MSYNLGTAEGRIVIDGSGASKGFNVAGAAANGFFRVIQSKLDSVRQLGQNMLKVGATTSAGLAVAVKSAASFEERLSAIKAVSGATASEMDDISKAALRIGKDTSFSATEAASAMEELVKAGVETKDVLNGAADATVALAAAGELSLPQAAEIASSAMNNFNLTGKDMAGVADLIAGAANASAIDVGQFGMSLQQSGAVANLVGLEFDDLAVAIAEMGQAGIKGSDAGTSIKTFLSNLIPTTNDQIEKFRELGLISVNSGTAMQKLAKVGIRPLKNDFDSIVRAIEKYNKANDIGPTAGTAAAKAKAIEYAQSLGVLQNQFFDSTGKAKDFKQIQDVLATSTKNLTKEQKLSTFNMLFGSDAIRAASVFAEEGAAGYDKMAASMGKVTAADVAKTRLDNLNGSIEQFKGSMETAMITIGSVFLPVVRKIVDGATALVNVFNNLPAPVQKAIAVLLGIVAVVSTLIGGIITLSFALAPLVAHFVAMFVLKQLGSIILVGARAMMTGAGAAGVYSAAMSRASLVMNRFIRIGRVFILVSKLMRAAWLIMTGPIGIAIAAILALVAIGKVLYDRWAPFHDLVNRIGGAIKNTFNAAMREMHRWVQMVVAGFQGFKSADGGFYEFLFRIGAIARTVWEGLKKLGQTFQTSVIPALQQAGGGIVQAFLKAWQGITQTFKTQLVPALQQLWTTIQTQLMPALIQLWTAIKPLVLELGKFALIIATVLLVALFKLSMFLLQYIIPAVIKVAAFLITLLAPAIKFIIQIIILIVTWIVKLASLLITGVSAAISVVAGVIRAGIEIIKSVLKAGVNAAKAVWNAVWRTFGPLIKAVWNLIVAVIRLGIEVIKLIIRKGVAAFKAVWNPAWNFIKTVASNVMSAVKSKVSSILNGIKNFFSSAGSTIKSIWNKAFNAIDKATGGKLSAVKSKIKSAISSIKKFFSGAIGWLKSAGADIIQGLINGITSKIGALTSKISAVTNKVKSITNKIMQIKSPSKVYYKIGAYMMSGWLNGIKANAPNLYAYMKKLASKIADIKVPKAKKNQVANLVANYTTDLTKLNKKIDSVQSKLKDATQKYKDLVAEAKEYKKSLSETTQGNITDITADQGTVLTADDIMASLQDRAKYAEQFYKNLKKLKEAGLDKDYLQQITEAGAEAGGATAMALVANLDSIDTINALQTRLAKAGDKIGAFAVKNFKQAGIDAAKGVVKGLESQESALEKAITKLAKKMVKALKKTLKIKSPSRATFDVGLDTADGMIGGLEARQRKLEEIAASVGTGTLAAIAGAQKKIDLSAIGSAGLLGGTATSSSAATAAGKNVSVTQNIYNPVAERSSESTNKELQKLTTMGML